MLIASVFARARRVLLGVLTLSVLAVAVASAATPAPAPKERADAPPPVEVVITDDGPMPATVVVVPGQTVQWVNRSERVHHLRAEDGSFDSGELLPFAGFSTSFDEGGAVSYSSETDSWWTGTVQVALSELPGDPAAPVSEHIPDMPFPEVDPDDISVHPEVFAHASRTRALVGFQAGTTVAQANAALAATGAHIIGGLPDLGVLLVRADDDEDFAALDATLAELRTTPGVAFAAMSFGVAGDALPSPANPALNDWTWEYGGSGGNWGLEVARFPQAWNLLDEIRRRGNRIGTAIVDGGFDYHDDLSALEVPEELCRASDPSSCRDTGNDSWSVGDVHRRHGNHVAGTIGADYSPRPDGGMGVSGGNPVAHMTGYSMAGWGALRDGEEVGEVGTVFDKQLELFALLLASDQPEPLRVINYSAGAAVFDHEAWRQQLPRPACRPGTLDDDVPTLPGSSLEYCTPDNYDPWLTEFTNVGRAAAEVALRAAQANVLIVQSAGNHSNGAASDGRHFCPDESLSCGRYPIRAEWTQEFAWAAARWGTDDLPQTAGVPNPILVVEGIADDGSVLAMSNVGGDIAAPGGSVMSTGLYGDYATMSGTSMAAPHVSAALGYLLAYKPDLTIEEARKALIDWARPAAAEPTSATTLFDWSRPVRHGRDPLGFGVVEPHDSWNRIAPLTWPVDLNACGSTVSGERVQLYTWEVDGQEVAKTTSCRHRLELPDLGTYQVTLTATTPTGQTATETQQVQVRDYFIASIGDSIASGEGVPDIPKPNLLTRPSWQDRRCQRSAYGGPQLAGRMLEAADPTATITFLHLACSGARMMSDADDPQDTPPADASADSGGLMSPYVGQRPTAEEATQPLQPQLEALKDLVDTSGRQLDALLISIGANDMRFSAILKDCLVAVINDCNQSQAREIFERRIPLLAARYDELNRRIAQHFPNLAAHPERILISEYPDPTSSDGSVTLGCLGVSQADAAWAANVVVPALNQAVRDAANRHGWTMVDGINLGGFSGHGYCSDDSWIVSIPQSLLRQGNEDGAFHPNRTGHAHYARRIVEKLPTDVTTRGTAPAKRVPSAPRLDVFASLLSLPEAVDHLVDVNDASADGNRRIERTLAPDGTVIETPDETIGGAEGAMTAPDGRVDLRDLRRFRDAWLQTCQTDMAGSDCPDRALIELDGDADHPKRDLNGDGCVYGTPDCPTPEHAYPRFDFNGDGLIAFERYPDGTPAKARVPLRADGTPAETWADATSMTDLEVLASRFAADEGLDAAAIAARMHSADLEIHAPKLFTNGVTEVDVQVRSHPDGAVVAEHTLKSPDESAIVTVPLNPSAPLTQRFSIHASGTGTDGSVTAVPRVITGLGFGADRRLDICSRFDLRANPDVVKPGESALVTLGVITCPEDGGDIEVEGLPVAFSVTPEGEGHATVDPTTATTGADGSAETWFHAGTERTVYDVTATVDLGDDLEAEVTTTVRSGELKIHYLWQQTTEEYFSEGTTRWPAQASDETPDCASEVLSSIVLRCIDWTRLEIDPDAPSPTLVREGVLRGFADDFTLDERVNDDPVTFLQTWQVSDPDGSNPRSGSRRITWTPLDPTRYTDHEVDEVAAEVTDDGLIVKGLHRLSELGYAQQESISGDAAPLISSHINGNLSAGSLWALHHRRYNDDYESGEGTYFQHGSAFSEPIELQRLPDGTFEPYNFCTTIRGDHTTTAPVYTGREIIGYTESGDQRVPRVGRSATWLPGEVPVEAGPAGVELEIALVMVATFDDEPVELEIPDCSDHQPPTADFVFEPAAPDEGSAVSFRDRSRHGTHGITSWRWDFGDGTTSTTRSPVHAYEQSGTYTVTLTVVDSEGGEATITKPVVIANVPPTAKMHDVTVPVGAEITIRIEADDVSPADYKELRARLVGIPGAGTVEETIDTGNLTITVQGASHTAGSYPLTLTVTDPDGGTATVSATLTVVPGSLVADFITDPAEPEVGEVVTFTDASAGTAAITDWSWDFGDGSTATGEQVVHRFSEPGAKSVKLTVTDADGETATTTRVVVVTEPPAPEPDSYPCPGLDAAECEFLHRINAYRIANNLPILRVSPTLTAGAERHSTDLAAHQRVSHDGSDGSTPRIRATEAGYPEDTLIGENVLNALNGTAERAFLQWRYSPPHDANMRRGLYKAIGIARVQGDDGLWYWTTKFGDLVDSPGGGQAAATPTSAATPTFDVVLGAHFRQEQHPAAGTGSIPGFDVVFGEHFRQGQHPGVVAAGRVTTDGPTAPAQDEPRTLKLSVTPSGASEGTAEARIVETGPRPAFTVVSAYPSKGYAVTFVNRSTDADGEPIAAVLDPGDGSETVTIPAGGSHRHTYADEAEVTAALTVEDGGTQRVASLRMDVETRPVPRLEYDGEDDMRLGDELRVYGSLGRGHSGVAASPVIVTIDSKRTVVMADRYPEVGGGMEFRDYVDVEGLGAGSYELVFEFPGSDMFAPAELRVPFAIHEWLPPRADAGGPYVHYVGRTIELDASWSYGRDEVIVRYEWDLDDDGDFELSGTESKAQHVWEEPHEGVVRLRVTDARGAQVEATAPVRIVAGQPPRGFTTRASVTDSGEPADDWSGQPSISADGQHVAFTSQAQNLTGTQRYVSQVLVRDATRDTTVLISRALDGTPGTYSSTEPSISADGRYVAFVSAAPNLVAAPSTTPGRSHIYLYDRDADGDGIYDEEGATELRLVSSAGGQEGQRSSWEPRISADGSTIVYMTDAANVVTGGSEWDNLAVYDVATGTTTPAHRLPNGTFLQYPGEPAVSGDGQRIVFAARDENWNEGIFLYDRQAGTLERADRSSTGEVADSSSQEPRLSGDGRHLLFYSWARNLDSAVDGEDGAYYIRDLVTGTTRRLQVLDVLGEPAWISDVHGLSWDGRHVLLSSSTPALVVGKTTGHEDIFVLDRDADGNGIFDEPDGISITRESVSSAGEQADTWSYEAVMSGGPGNPFPRYVAFVSGARNLVNPPQPQYVQSVFVRDRAPDSDVVTKLTYDGPSSGPVGASLEWAARLTDAATGAPLADLDITFTLGSVTRTVRTDTDGWARVTVVLDGPPGERTLSVSFAGDTVRSSARVDVPFEVVGNTAPVAVTGGSYRVFAGDELVLDASGSNDGDPGDAVVAWEWDLDGDGDFDDATGEIATLTWEQVQAVLCGGTCAETGQHLVRLRVTDRAGATATATTSVHVVVDYVLEIGPSSQAIAPGASNAFAVSVLRAPSFAGEVELSVGSLPSGVTAEFDRTSLGAADDVAVLTLRAASDAPSLRFDVTVTGASGAVSRSATASARVAYGLVPVCYGSVAGVVTDAASGAPIAGATILFSNGHKVTTDAEGRYRWDDAPLGSFNAPLSHGVSADKTGYWGESKAITLMCGVTRRLDLQLTEQQHGALGGTVVVGERKSDGTIEPTGEPINGVRVRIISGDVPDETTGADGSFEFDRLLSGFGNTPRSYTVEASAPGYWTRSRIVTVRPGERTVEVLPLVAQCRGTVTGGTVTRIDGGDASGAAVSLVSPGGTTITTVPSGPDGSFAFNESVLLAQDNAPAAYRIEATKRIGDDLWSGAAEARLDECGAVVGGSPTLRPPPPPPPAGVVTGEVHDEETGEPLGGAQISIGGRNTATDSEGRYTVVDVPLGSWQVTASRSTHWSESASVTVTEGSPVEQDFVLLRRRTGSVEGRVVDAETGQPLQGVAIRQGISVLDTTDADGRYSATGLDLERRNAPADRFLQATLDGYWPESASVRISADEAAVRNFELLKQCDTARISGVVVNAFTLEPIEGATVNASGQSVLTDADGEFVIAGIATSTGNQPRPVTVTASAPGFHTQSQQVTVFCGADIRVEFGRPDTGTGTIIGTVTSSVTGHPVPGVFIGSEFGGSAETDETGSYRLTEVPLGEDGADRLWRVSALPEGAEAKHAEVTVRKDAEVRQDFVVDVVTRQLIVSKQGEGTVASEPGAGYHLDGTEVELTAEAAPGWEFSHWDVNGERIEETSTSVVLDADVTATAVFTREVVPRKLTVAVVGDGTVTPAPGEHVFDEGSVVEVSAVPAAGWRFVRWDGPVADASAASTSVTVSADVAVTAVFEEIPPPVQRTLTVAVVGDGAVTPAPGEHVFDEGSVVEVSAVPAAGWRFVRWDGPVADASAASTSVTVSADVAVTAVFEEIPPAPVRTLTVAVVGDGSVTPAVGAHEVADGGAVKLTATAAKGWRFSHWDVSGRRVTQATTTVTVNDDLTATAVFIRQRTLTVTVEGQGQVTPRAGAHVFDQGSEVTLTAKAASGWELKGWRVEGTDRPATATLKVKMDADRKVTAVFARRVVEPEPEPEPQPDPDRPGPTPGKDEPGRLGGKTRVQTAAVVAEQAFPKGADWAVLAVDARFPDALAGATAAAALDAPILLTSQGSLPDATASTLKALKVKRVLVLGGKGAISDDVVRQLQALGLKTERIGGSDRFQTARLIAQRFAAKGALGGTALLATGERHPDALAAGPLTYAGRLPLLLTPTGKLSADTRAALADPKLGIRKVLVLGGKAAVDDSVVAELKRMGLSVQRLAGRTRVETAVAVADHTVKALKWKPTTRMLATGTDFADALTVAPLAGRAQRPLLLTESAASLGRPTLDALRAGCKAITHIQIVGGSAAISDRVATQARAAIDC